MDEQQYIVLEIRSTDATRRRGPASAGGPATAAVSVEPFTLMDAADARRAPGVEVAPLLPMKLVEPVFTLAVATPETPGSAWASRRWARSRPPSRAPASRSLSSTPGSMRVEAFQGSG